MPEIYDKTDLTWISRGDFSIINGDLGDTYTDPLRSFYQEIRTRIKSEVGDWYHHRNLGATLSDFIGEPSLKVTAESIKTRMMSSLTNDGFIKTSDLSIKYLPLDVDRIVFQIKVSVAPTALNAGSDTLKISALYNYAENNVFVR